MSPGQVFVLAVILIPLLVIFGWLSFVVWLEHKEKLAKAAAPVDPALRQRLERLEGEVKQLREMVYDTVIERSDRAPFDRLAEPAPGKVDA